MRTVNTVLLGVMSRVFDIDSFCLAGCDRKHCEGGIQDIKKGILL